MNRLERVADQLKNAASDDVVICSAVRTPITKANSGLFKDTPPERLLAEALKGAVEKAKLAPKEVQDVVVGNLLQPGAGAMTARMSLFLAGFPETTTAMAVNRLGAAGLEACSMIANNIKAGVIDIGIGAGVESMSFYDMMEGSLDYEKLSEAVFDHP